MKHSEAVYALRRMVIAIQRARGRLIEAMESEPGAGLDEIGEAFLARTNPWLFDEKRNPTIPVTRLLEQIDKGEHTLTPGEFINFMWIVRREPMIEVIGMGHGDSKKFPEPDTELIRTGWEPEDGQVPINTPRQVE